jgi:hypothetical protein
LFHGFDASFVGDAGSNGLGGLPVSSFFTLGPFARVTPVRGSGNRTFADVIPASPLGELPDDVMGFQVEGSGSYSALVIDVGAGGETLLRRNEDGSLFYQELDPMYEDHSEIIEAARLAHGGSSRPDAKREEGKVPWRVFVRACYVAIDRWRPDLSLRFSSSCTSGMENFLTELNGPVPARLDSFVYRMTLYQVQVGEKTGFPSKIRKVHADLLHALHRVANAE